MKYYIYKICKKDCDFVYVGSTRAYTKRKAEHKRCCTREDVKNYNLKVYQIIRENGGWDEWKMICIDEIEVENRRQAEMKEEEWRVKLSANMNQYKAFRTEQEKKEYDLGRKKEYRSKHKEQYLAKRKIYIERKKDIITQQMKEYYEKNRDKIAEQRKAKTICCECGCEVCKDGLARHKKSKKHLELMSQNL